jgi:DNA-binding transcriptional ArsR family regulator
MTNAGRVFKALADPTRRQILQELKSGPLAAGEIVDLFSITGPAISRHLAILKSADLVTEQRDGNRILYSLQPETLSGCLSEFLSAICPTQRIMSRKIAKRRRRP